MPWIDDKSGATGGFTSMPVQTMTEPEAGAVGDDTTPPDTLDDTTVSHDPRYASLRGVLLDAYLQAAEGKGEVRHGDRHPFEDQIGCWIARNIHSHPLGQAVKKIHESQRLDAGGAIHELRGAIVEITKAIIVLESAG